MVVEFIEPALLELDDAIKYYDLQLPGLGKIFFEEIIDTISIIDLFPEIWTKNSKNTRKSVMRKFPYNVIYSIKDKKIFIICIAHQNREPEYWIDRIKW
ncbi:MAG: hypothetical protein JXA68_01710 [Ignavibacteriales bacterium]|nr:hypothetical protein [Ignavibacteriales bacterium]